MPIQRCTVDGQAGWRWGDSGTCYLSRDDAEKQAKAAYANGYTGDQQGLALDATEPNRYKDQDGRLHVRVNNISKANICGYLGREIPGGSALGLKADTVYQLLRDPAELRKAVATANNIPLLIEHVPVSPGDHKPGKVVGSTGTDAKFVDPHLQNSIVIWEDGAIAGVETGEQRELSMGYRYEADMTPGEFKGVKYDGVMRNIKFNHVALVEKGRAGSDVMVGDQQPKTETKPMTTKKAALGKLAESFRTQATAFAADAALNKTYLKLAADAEKARDEMEEEEEAMDEPLPFEGKPEKPAKDKKAKDEESDEEKMEREGRDKKARDKKAADKRAMDKRARDKARDESEAEAEANNDPEEEKEEVKADKRAKDKKAMDSAISLALDADRKRAKAVREAERAVRPWVGDLALACDTAAEVYQHALKGLGVDTRGIDDEKALRLVLDAQPKPGAAQRQPSRMALDAAAVSHPKSAARLGSITQL